MTLGALAAGRGGAQDRRLAPVVAGPSAAPRVVVAGASFGGISGALAIRRLVPGADLVLVERERRFTFTPATLRYLFGRAPLAETTRSHVTLERRGLRVLHATVLGLDRDHRRLLTSAGALPYDYCLLATGLGLAPEAVPGLAANLGVNLCPYAPAASLDELRRRIAAFRGGDVVVATPETPYKCPPAPYEYALAWAALFRERRLRGRVILVDPRSRPTPAVLASGLARAMARHRPVLVYEPFTRVLAVDAAARIVDTEAGRLRFDVLSVVPPHRLAPFLLEAELGDPYVEVDPRTFRSGRDERLYAVGDAADTPYARTASTAARAGTIAGHAIARALGFDVADPGPPINVCFPEIAPGQALRIDTTWTHEIDAHGAARVQAGGLVDATPSRASFQRRLAWEAGTLRELFGP